MQNQLICITILSHVIMILIHFYFFAETHIMISQEIIQRRADIWPDPFKFDPDRFGRDAPRIKPFTYMPFMAGPRSCIGRHFAMLEMKIMLSRMFRDFKFIDPDPALREIAMKTVVTSKPKDGVFVGFEARRGTSQHNSLYIEQIQD